MFLPHFTYFHNCNYMHGSTASSYVWFFLSTWIYTVLPEGFMQECNLFVGNGDGFSHLTFFLAILLTEQTVAITEPWGKSLQYRPNTAIYLMPWSPFQHIFWWYWPLLFLFSGFSENKYAGYLKCFVCQEFICFIVAFWINCSLV